jgi:ribosome-binding protein aMBF1 (putative translation factor)
MEWDVQAVVREAEEHLRRTGAGRYRQLDDADQRSTLAGTVAALRRGRAWSREALARRCGLSPRVVRAVEHGRLAITPETVHALAGGLGCGVAAVDARVPGTTMLLLVPPSHALAA